MGSVIVHASVLNGRSDLKYLDSGITAPWILMEVGATSLCQIYSCVDFKILSIDREDKQTRKI